MKRYANEPTIFELEKVFAHSIEVPQGFKTHAQHLCRKTLGKCYYSWVPTWIKRWHSGKYHSIAHKPWAVNEDAVWQYRGGRLYFKDQGNFGIVTLAMLSKPKKK